MKDKIHQFSAVEKKMQDEFASFRTDYLKPFLMPLIRVGVTANMVSLLSLLVLFGFVYYVQSHPFVATLFIVLHVVLDGIDGPMARLQSKYLKMGTFTDMICDHIGFAVIVSTCIIVGLLKPFFGLSYLLLYILMILFIILRNLADVPPKYAFRTKYFFYIMFLIYALSGYNFLDYFAIIFSLVMVITNIYDYYILSKRIQ